MNDAIQANMGRAALRFPRRSAGLALAAALLTAFAATAQAPMRVLENVLESSTDFVNLPASPGGTINARECSDCPAYRLKFDGSTQYFLGKEPVPYAKLRKAAADAGQARIYVYFTPETRVLTRLRVEAPAAAPK
jgi:hypothetical protein